MEKRYINKNDFYSGEGFAKIKTDVDFCLRLIERLIAFNLDCKTKVSNVLGIPGHLIDYREVQFDYYDKVLRCIYYNCVSLKYVYDISTFMSSKGINYTIGEAYNDQRKHISFTAIVMTSSMFEFSRKEFERTLNGDKYFESLKQKYPVQAESLKLLTDFRNTVHSNAKWQGKKELVYKTRSGLQTIKKGQIFPFDYWTLYRIIKDSIELHMLLALNNEAVRIREVRGTINGQKIVAVKTDLKPEDLDKLFQSSRK